jgi:hypothetical protein
MLDFSLFRIKVFPDPQGTLSFEEERPRSEVLREIITTMPSSELTQGSRWHIGNVEVVDPDGLYLRIGRTSRTSVEVYDHGQFMDAEFETAPYTHVLVDIPLEVCGIARKPLLARNPITIAKRFVQLLTDADRTRQLHATLNVDQINDPSDLIAMLERAVSIHKFAFSISRPNPFDVNSDFVRPLQKTLEETRGTSGKVELKGDSLDAKSLEDLTRSAAATGADAEATMVLEPNSGRVKKTLKGNAADVTADDISGTEEKRGVLERIRAAYRSIRGTSTDDNE